MLISVFHLTAFLSVGAVKTTLGAKLPCQLETRLGPALTEQGVTRDVDEVRLQRQGADLHLQLRNETGALLGERTVRFSPADCAVLPRTLALLVRAWTQAALPRNAEKPVRAEVKTAAPAAIRAPPNGAPAPERSAPAPSPREEPLGETPASEEPAHVAETPAPAAEPPPIQSVAPPEPNQSTHRFTFALALAGGAGSTFQEPPTGQGSLVAELGFLQNWGVALEAGIETARTGSIGAGRVHATVGWASVFARRRVISNLHLMVGARLWLLQANAEGFTVNETTTLVTPGFAAQAEWRQPVYQGLYLMLRPGVSARIRPESLSIEGVGTALKIPAWGFFIHGGAGWNFD